MIIRNATKADQAGWFPLWQDYLDFYATTLPAAVSDFTWTRLMDPKSPLKLRLAVQDGQILGFAIHQHHPSTWVMGDDCYLEDLFVAQAARGKGTGRALINDLAAIARSRGWIRLYWNTDAGNATARKLYDSFTLSDGHVRYRFAVQ